MFYYGFLKSGEMCGNPELTYFPSFSFVFSSTLSPAVICSPIFFSLTSSSCSIMTYSSPQSGLVVWEVIYFHCAVRGHYHPAVLYNVTKSAAALCCRGVPVIVSTPWTCSDMNAHSSSTEFCRQEPQNLFPYLTSSSAKHSAGFQGVAWVDFTVICRGGPRQVWPRPLRIRLKLLPILSL